MSGCNVTIALYHAKPLYADKYGLLLNFFEYSHRPSHSGGSQIAWSSSKHCLSLRVLPHKQSGIGLTPDLL